jgi:hypothetical protein
MTTLPVNPVETLWLISLACTTMDGAIAVPAVVERGGWTLKNNSVGGVWTLKSAAVSGLGVGSGNDTQAPVRFVASLTRACQW